MNKKIVVFIVHNHSLIKTEMASLKKEFNAEHFFDPKEAEEFINVYRDEIFCVILDTAYIGDNSKYEAYLQLKKTILKGVNTLVTRFLSAITNDINEKSTLVDKDKFVDWKVIFGGQSIDVKSVNLLKKLFSE